MAVLAPLVLSADTITNMTVPSSVPLNQGITATGTFADDENVNGDVICALGLLDSNTQELITRASDQRTLADGTFYFPPFIVEEPLFIRGQTYTARVICGEASADGSFSVIQKQEVIKLGDTFIAPQGLMVDLRWWADSENSLIVILIAISFSLAVFFVWRLYTD